PVWAGLSNPIDLIASATADTYRRCLSALLASNEVDGVVVIFTPPLGTRADDVAAAVVEAADAAATAGRNVPVVTAFLGSPSVAGPLRSGRRPVPSFTYPETAVR